MIMWNSEAWHLFIEHFSTKSSFLSSAKEVLIGNMEKKIVYAVEVLLNACFLSLFKGFILRFPIWGDPADDNCFDDEVYWEVRLFCYH